MASSSPGPEEILIRVDLAAAAVSMPEADLRRRFWNPLISGGNVPENELERLERRVSDRFQEGLKERLRSLVPESTSSQENQGRRTFEAATKEDRRPSKEPPAVTQAQKRAALAAAIVVQTHILRYSSAIVGISVEGEHKNPGA